MANNYFYILIFIAHKNSGFMSKQSYHCLIKNWIALFSSFKLEGNF